MLEYWIWLTTRKKCSAAMAMDLLRFFPDIASVYHAHASDYVQALQTAGRDMRHVDMDSLMEKSLEEAGRIAEGCYQKSIEVLTCQDPQYPGRLLHIPDPPPVLYYRGNLPTFDEEAAVAIVGTRSASAYGCMMAKRMGYQVAQCGGLVVSGLAAGIDTMSMQGALMAGGTVTGVLGCGVDVVYPVRNREMFREVEIRGCLLSEYPPGTPPNAWNFPRRNRIISGLSCGVVVVEAPEKSGALITAQHALDQGRDVFAVPSNADTPGGMGSNNLLKQGAMLARCGWDVMQEYAAIYPDRVHAPQTDAPSMQTGPADTAAPDDVPASKPAAAPPPEKKVDNAERNTYIVSKKTMPKLPENEQTIYALLTHTPQPVDEIIEQSGLSATKAIAALTMLKIKGLAVMKAGEYYVLA